MPPDGRPFGWIPCGLGRHRRGITTQNSFPSGSLNTWNRFVGSSTISPTLSAPSSTERSTDCSSSSTRRSMWMRFFPTHGYGTPWNAREPIPGTPVDATQSDVALRPSTDAPSDSAQNSASLTGSQLSTTIGTTWAGRSAPRGDQPPLGSACSPLRCPPTCAVRHRTRRTRFPPLPASRRPATGQDR